MKFIKRKKKAQEVFSVQALIPELLQVHGSATSHIPTERIRKRGFAVPKEIKQNAILFIGCNPSYDLKTEKANPDYSHSHFYDLLDEGNHKYYRKFEQLSKETNTPWTHIDTLQMRETTQSSVESLFKHPEGLQFIVSQLSIFDQMLKESNPKVIVVCNTLARRFMGRDKDELGNNTWLGYEFKWDERTGTHRIISELSGLNNTPILFSSMLTGQRALDNGSFERLSWHLRRVLKTV